LQGVGNNPSIAAVEPRFGDAKTPSEQATSISTGQKIQANLCIAAPTKTFDGKTRDAIREAKLGALQSGASAAAFSNTEDQITSGAEMEIFRGSKSCFEDPAKGFGYKTAFEKFAFVDSAGIKSLQKVLGFCDPNLKGHESGKFDEQTRNAIAAAKISDKMSDARKRQLTDSKTNTLNSISYDSILHSCK
jgi:hypothetical protein